MKIQDDLIKDENYIKFTHEFFCRDLIKPIKGSKIYCASNYKLRVLLLEHLSCTLPKSLPPVSECCKELNIAQYELVSRLQELEESKFIIRYIDKVELCVIKNKQVEIELQRYYAELKETRRKNRDFFNDTYIINLDYNK